MKDKNIIAVEYSYFFVAKCLGIGDLQNEVFVYM